MSNYWERKMNPKPKKTPKPRKVLSDAEIVLAFDLSSEGCSKAEIGRTLGVNPQRLWFLRGWDASQHVEFMKSMKYWKEVRV